MRNMTAAPPIVSGSPVTGASSFARGSNVLEAERVGRALEFLELIRVPVADDRQVLLGGAKVLPDRQHLDIVLAEPLERLGHLIERLAEADHQPRLRHNLVAAELLGRSQHP